VVDVAVHERRIEHRGVRHDAAERAEVVVGDLDRPERTPSTISFTPPSCELANTVISTRPLVRSLTSLATSSA
jgi:hypothetical protein